MVMDSLYTPSLGVTRTFGLLTPEFLDPSRLYPVLYLLHGHDGSHRDWFDRTDVERYVDGLDIIVVFPDADNSWYVNSDEGSGGKYEDYLMKDLFRTVENRFRIDPTKRAIAGLSMGGYGALLYALKYPGRFAFAGSFSGAFVFPRFIEDTIRQPVGKHLASSLKRAFGPERSPTRLSNDVYTLFNAASPDRMPYIYLAAGIQDGFRFFLPGHRFFADSLKAAGMRYEYHETPGRHTWSYWDRELKKMLVRLREEFGMDRI
jgi:S-formylglutathione hydrolase FrmB